MPAAARRYTSRALFALVYALLAFFAATALADDAPLMVPIPPFQPPGPSEYVMRGGLAILLIGACVRALREVFTDTLAPVPSTKLSRALVLIIAVVSGALLGLIHVGVPVVDGQIGYVVGGVGLGLVTFLGAKLLPDSARLDTVGKVGAANADAPPPVS